MDSWLSKIDDPASTGGAVWEPPKEEEGIIAEFVGDVFEVGKDIVSGFVESAELPPIREVIADVIFDPLDLLAVQGDKFVRGKPFSELVENTRNKAFGLGDYATPSTGAGRMLKKLDTNVDSFFRNVRDGDTSGGTAIQLSQEGTKEILNLLSNTSKDVSDFVVNKRKTPTHESSKKKKKPKTKTRTIRNNSRRTRSGRTVTKR